MLQLSKAKAMASVLQELGDPSGNELVDALQDSRHPRETREWLHSIVGEALRNALDNAGAAFRNSTTGQEWLRVQLDGLAKAGA